MGIQVANKGKILTFGEILLRITPDAGGDWLRHNSLPFFIGGAELNVATALALWEVETRYFTAMPDNGLTAQLTDHLQQKGIDTSAIQKSGERIGLFFLTKGQDMKHDALIYDRAGSSFASLQPNTIDWDNALDGVNWFHFSAISPALSQQTADVCLEALEAASAKGITISLDLNYRAKLWQYGKLPKDVMPALVQHCDLIMGNVWAMNTMLGTDISTDLTETGQKSLYLKEAQYASEQIMKWFPKCKAVANTFRFGNNERIDYYGTLYTDGHLYHSEEYHTDEAVDKVGSGDAFMAGLIYGYCNNYNPAQIAEYASAAAFTKLFVPSDATTIKADQIIKTMKNAG
ncbi:sugar kinase [Mucilaginibacter ginkgonis]|uniref:Sugar kinase n=1 Tax=Mucilaginibacter ginkgonis TaxID=2682091 RepID=A0A6I4HUG3_9SPHI|nr:sugar kinase [Mucilaginibacter ginkgonis]QQL50439.1 sugar kinase [Mucilaginibacter ginkgonis]